jgi:D-alanine-D-alanine ligase-like ATP-grasp enzyme
MSGLMLTEGAAAAVDAVRERLSTTDIEFCSRQVWVTDDSIAPSVSLLPDEQFEGVIDLDLLAGTSAEAESALELIRRTVHELAYTLDADLQSIDVTELSTVQTCGGLEPSRPPTCRVAGPAALQADGVIDSSTACAHSVLIVVSGDAVHHWSVREAAGHVSEWLTARSIRVDVHELGLPGPALRDVVVGSQYELILPFVVNDLLSSAEVQQVSELTGQRVFGSPAAATAVACDRLLAKRELTRAGLHCSPASLWSAWAVQTVGGAIGLQAVLDTAGRDFVVRSRWGASDVGGRVYVSAQRTAAAISTAFNYSSAPLIVEPCVAGALARVLVTGPGEDPHVVASGTLDSGIAALLGPFPSRPLSHRGKTLAIAEPVALQAYFGLGCRDMALVDVIVDDHDQGWVHDVKPLLDLSPTGIVADVCNASGVSIANTVGSLIEQTLSSSELPARAA